MPKTQGISARETCPDDILVILLNGEMGFENLAEKLAKDYARATVSKYLTELYEKSPFVQRKGRRGNYYLTEKGRKKAKTKQFVKQISEISDEFTEQFILNYKDYVMNRVKSSLFYPYKLSSMLNHGILLPSEYKKDWSKWNLSLLKMTIRPYPEIEKLSQALETDLTKHGFTDEEILKLWVIGNGYLMMKTVKAYGAPIFFSMLPFKFPPIILSLRADENNPEVHKKRIREILKKFNADEIQTETKIYDLFP
jgi:predicted transcriptional regulator